MAAGAKVQIWIPASMLTEMDARRGKLSRGQWLRAAAFAEPQLRDELETPSGQMAALQRIADDFRGADSVLAVQRLDGERKAVLAVCRLQQQQELPAVASRLAARLDAITSAQGGVDADIEPPAIEEIH